MRPTVRCDFVPRSGNAPCLLVYHFFALPKHGLISKPELRDLPWCGKRIHCSTTAVRETDINLGFGHLLIRFGGAQSAPSHYLRRKWRFTKSPSNTKHRDTRLSEVASSQIFAEHSLKGAAVRRAPFFSSSSRRSTSGRPKLHPS